MSDRLCRKCRGPLPEQLGAGRPRVLCDVCAPPRKGSTNLLPVIERLLSGQTEIISVQELADAPRPTSHRIPRFTLGPRGQELYDQLSPALKGMAMHRELLLEACRLADRLDRMESLLRGDQALWLHFAAGEDWNGVPEIKVNISSIAVEARQAALALRTITTELRTATAKQDGAGQEEEYDPISAIQADVLDKDEVGARRRRRTGA